MKHVGNALKSINELKKYCIETNQRLSLCTSDEFIRLTDAAISELELLQIKNNSTIEHTGWRLPTLKELLTLVNVDIGISTKDKQFWTNRYIHAYIGHIWCINIHDGSSIASKKSDIRSIIYVRTNKEDVLEWSKPLNRKMDWADAIEYAKFTVMDSFYKGVK